MRIQIPERVGQKQFLPGDVDDDGWGARFFALGMGKDEFIRSIAFSFLVYKTAQFVSVIYFGLLTWPLFGVSVAASAGGLGAFWLGLRTQDRVDQVTFNRVVLGFLGLLGIWLVIRALR